MVLGADDAGLSIEGIWSAWNPWLSESSETNNTETLRGSVIAILGQSAGPGVVGGGQFGDSLLGSTQSLPSELRIVVSHPLLFNNEHRHRSQCVLLLSRLASYSTSYMDFLVRIRYILLPRHVTGGSDGRVRLPVISSSAAKSYGASERSASQASSDSSKQWDDEFCDRLGLLCESARTGYSFPRNPN